MHAIGYGVVWIDEPTWGASDAAYRRTLSEVQANLREAPARIIVSKQDPPGLVRTVCKIDDNPYIPEQLKRHIREAS